METLLLRVKVSLIVFTLHLNFYIEMKQKRENKNMCTLQL